MRYFPDYVSNYEEKIQLNIVNYKDSIISINDEHQLSSLNRAFNTDIVCINKNHGLVSVQNVFRKEHYVTGILMINSKVKYGCNKRNNPIYLFKSMDKKYPDFKVSSTIGKKTTKNQYVYIKFTSWRVTSSLPKGEIIQIIGAVDSMDNINNTILYLHHLYFKKYKKKIVLTEPTEVVNNLRIISIDPPGCTDIDDAFSVLDNVINIYLADTTSVLLNNLSLFEYAKNQTTSIYSPNKTYHMLPESISTNSCSLLENKVRSANVCQIIIENNKIIDYYFFQTSIKVTKNYSYEEIDQLYEEKEDEYIVNSLNLIDNIDFNYNSVNQDTLSHKCIEKLMVIVNHLSFLRLQYLKKDFIVRCHPTPDLNLENVPENLKNYYNLFLNKAATYTLNSESNFHYGLNIDGYTHFTSPLRRLVDSINHLILFKDQTFSKEELQLLSDRCNSINKYAKKAEIEWRKLELFDTLRESYNGFIISFSNNKVNFYIPELKLFLNYKLYHRKLEEFCTIEEEDNNIKLFFKGSLEEEYKLFQPVTVIVHKRLEQDFIYKKLLFSIN